MSELWSTLVPLMVASAILPIQIAITVLLLRSASGRVAAAAWVLGMTVVRLAQWVVFGLLLGGAAVATDDPQAAGVVESTILLLVGILFLVAATRKLLDQPDEDAPAPRWMAMVESATPGRAFLLGAGVVAISAKLWAFTLAAIGAIWEADLGQPTSTLVFLVFLVAAESVHLGALGVAVLTPDRSAAWLDRLSDALQRHSRSIAIVLGFGFGAWFVWKALSGLGVI